MTPVEQYLAKERREVRIINLTLAIMLAFAVGEFVGLYLGGL